MPCKIILILVTFITVCSGKEYLDKALFFAVEDGNVKKAVDLLNHCANDTSCTFIPQKEYDHYEIWDFVRPPTPSFLRPKINIIRSLKTMTPMTLIHLKTPTHLRYLSTGEYYRNPDQSCVVEFNYQLSPETHLSACVFWTGGRSSCTSMIKAKKRPTSGGEIFRLKRSHEDFYIRFAFKCRSVQCILIIRQIRLYGVIKSETPFPQNSSVLSNRAVLCLAEPDGSRPRLWIDFRHGGSRDMTQLIQRAIDREREELEMLSNLQNSTNTTKTPLLITAITRAATTDTTISPSRTLEPVDYYDDEPGLNCNATSNDTDGFVRVCQSRATMGTALAIELFAIVADNFGLFEPPIVVEKFDDDVQSMQQIFSWIRNIFQKELALTVEKTSTATIIEPLALVTAYFIASTLVALNQNENSLFYEFILHVKIYDDVVERSISFDQSEMLADSMDDTSFSLMGPEFDIERALYLLGGSIGKDMHFDRPDIGPSWPLIVNDNYPVLQLDQFENWLVFDVSMRKTTFRQTWVLEGNENYDKIYGTQLTNRRPTATIRSNYYQCSKGATVVRMPMLYKFFASSSSVTIEVCLKFMFSSAGQIVCAPGRNATTCSKNWCGSDFANAFNPIKDAPFQVIVKIQSETNVLKEFFEQAILHIRWFATDNSENHNCLEVPRPTVSNVVGNMYPDCQKSDVPMVEADSTNLSMVYTNNNGQKRSTTTRFVFLGSWYTSTCTLDFSQNLSKFNTPFTSLLPPKILAISAVISPEKSQYMVGENFGCTNKVLSVKFMLSVTSPDLYVHICLYRDGELVAYSCSESFQSGAPDFPNFLFESDFPAEKMEISAGTRNSSQTGTVTILFEAIEVTCLSE